ncbi:MAG: DUF4292 domain-containing protein [Bacteroidota bacterium]
MSRLARYLFLPLLVSACATWSCAPTRTVVADASTISAESVLQRVRGNESRIRSLKAHGRLTVERHDFGSSGSFDMVLKKPDSLLVKLSGPFGIDAGAVLLTPQEFRFYNRFANQLVIGPTTPGNLHSIFNVDIDYSDILTIFSGMIPVLDEGTTLRSYGVNENRYFLTLLRNGNVHQYWVDPESFIVSKYQLLNGVGKLMVDAKSTVRNDRRHGVLPRSVRFTFHKQRTRVSIFYQKVKINVPDIRLTFSVPKSVETLYW